METTQNRMFHCKVIGKEKFEDAKGVIRSRKSRKDRQYYGQKKTDKHRYTYLHRKLKIEQHEPH